MSKVPKAEVADRQAAPARIWPLHAPDLVLVGPYAAVQLREAM